MASSLQDWLKDRHALSEETAAEIAEKLAEKWRSGAIQVEQAPPIVLEPAPEMEPSRRRIDSLEGTGTAAAKQPRRRTGSPSMSSLSFRGRYSGSIGRGEGLLDGKEACVCAPSR